MFGVSARGKTDVSIYPGEGHVSKLMWSSILTHSFAASVFPPDVKPGVDHRSIGKGAQVCLPVWRADQSAPSCPSVDVKLLDLKVKDSRFRSSWTASACRGWRFRPRNVGLFSWFIPGTLWSCWDVNDEIRSFCSAVRRSWNLGLCESEEVVYRSEILKICFYCYIFQLP